MRLACFPRSKSTCRSRKGEKRSYLSNKGLTSSLGWRNYFSGRFDVDSHHRRHKRPSRLRPKLGLSAATQKCAGGRDRATGVPPKPKFGLQLEKRRTQVLRQPQALQKQLKGAQMRAWSRSCTYWSRWNLFTCSGNRSVIFYKIEGSPIRQGPLLLLFRWVLRDSNVGRLFNEHGHDFIFRGFY